MGEPLRHKVVSVAVIYDPGQGFLLWNNPRWGGYSFPMKHVDPGDAPARAVLRALDDVPLTIPNPSAVPLEYIGWAGWSPTAREQTYYDYHVFEVDPGVPASSIVLHPDTRFLAYDSLKAAINVTDSTKFIAESLVERQDVAIAVVSRSDASAKEYLLVYKSNY